MKTIFHLFSKGTSTCLLLISTFILRGQDIPSTSMDMKRDNVTAFTDLSVTRRVDGVAQLRWNSTTGNELVTYFIEHSIDGKHFRTIGELHEQKKGSSFDFLHKSIAKGLNYYRLRMLSPDGSPYYSVIQQLFFPRVKQSLRIFPTITIGTANLMLDANDGEVMQVKIFDLAGKAILENVVRFQSQIAKLGIEDLDRGLYTVVLNRENGEQLRSKLLVAF